MKGGTPVVFARNRQVAMVAGQRMRGVGGPMVLQICLQRLGMIYVLEICSSNQYKSEMIGLSCLHSVLPIG